jgi:beta-glucosidase
MARFPFQNPDLPASQRVKDLLDRLTLEEKISQMVNESKAIPRLDIPEYNWWGEGLHGVARMGIATVFPQAIGLAASFDTDLIHRVAVAISDEARAKHHESARQGYRRQYQGLTEWSPNVNIFRDPRWGRGQETYGEDPYLTGRMGVAFVRGLQGDDPKSLKVVATPKHFAVHSGPEALRHRFDAVVSLKDLRETYLPAFHDCVVEGGAASVMGAYSRVNGEPCCASPTLLGEILRKEWGFKGYVVSDCGAIADLYTGHLVVDSPEKAAALAVKMGCDLECGRVYPALGEAVKRGLIKESEIDASLGRLLEARMKLGMFDPPARSPYGRIPYEKNNSPEHRSLALEAARASLVLLKNEGGFLPLKKDLGCIAVIGPNADDREVLLGNYKGTASPSVTILEGIRKAVSPRTRIFYATGSDIVRNEDTIWGVKPDDGFAEALAAAERSDVTVMVLGLNNTLEGEEGGAPLSEWQGDRIRVELPAIQRRLFDAVAKKGRPIVLVLLAGSPLAIPAEHERARAVLYAWYPGEEGGTAVADVLFGDHNPSGRLPVTFVESVDQLPPFTDYAMEGRTYRFMKSRPLYPFGFGLSFTSFTYSDLALDKVFVPAGEPLGVSVKVKNEGKEGGHEVVQLYLSDLESSVRAPLRRLVGFSRVYLDVGESKEVPFTVSARQMALIDGRGKPMLEPGMFRLSAGGRQPDERSRALTGSSVVEADFEVGGKKTELPY